MSPRPNELRPRQGRLRICLYARYSTDEQDESSIPDQFAYCRRHLQSLGIDLNKVTIDEFSDPETSGETVFRPGINQVRDGVQAKLWDMIVCEDVSRWFRHLSACCDLVETAFDNGIRIIAVNDDVDSDEAGWDDRFYEAARHHAKTNRFTSNRIKRKLEALWEKGAAVGPLRSGYRRIPPDEEYVGHGRHRRKKPKFDEIDQDWQATVYETFERIAAGEPAWSVGAWLTTVGLPKCGKKGPTVWADRDVNALIRRGIYRGHDTYRHKVSIRKIRTGVKLPRRNELAFVLTRDMPHHRIVPDWLWNDANKQIDDRMVANGLPCGEDHPLAGIPRDSRFPLSTLFVCGLCEHKMYADGRNEGGYRCGGTRTGDCWNKATTLRSVTHQQISKAVVAELLELDGVRDVVVEHIRQRIHDDRPRQVEEKRLRALVKKLASECDRLGEAIATGDADDAPVTLIAKLRQREDGWAEAEAELERLQHNAAARPQVSTDDIKNRLEEVADRLLEMDRAAGALLARLIDGKIEAFPMLQFGTNKVVLRAKFTFRPVGLLPDRLLAALSGTELGEVVEILPAKEIVLDLFEPSHVPKFAIDAVSLKEAKGSLTLQKIADRLGISKRQAHLALQLGIKMREAGIDDPFIPLTEAPASASRWRDSKRQLAAAS